MAGLQRSVETFRRTGSSGLVWDDRFYLGDVDQMNKDEGRTEERDNEFRELRPSRSMGFVSSGKMDRSQSNNVGQTTCSVSPSSVQPLPKVSERSVFGIFRKSMSTNATKQSKVGSR